MKKILIASNMVLLVIVFFQACNWKKDPSNPGPVKPQTSFCADSNCYTNDGSLLTGMINASLAMRMAEDYSNDAGKQFIWNDKTKTDSLDALNIWFDLKKIKNFIGFIESTLCKGGCVNTDHYGIRMYYAKYPDTKDMKEMTDLFGVPKEYANHHTVFMVPTYWDPAKGRNIDFDPNSPFKDCKLHPYNPSSGKAFIFGPFYKIAGSESNEQNHGNITPPPAGGKFPTVE